MGGSSFQAVGNEEGPGQRRKWRPSRKAGVRGGGRHPKILSKIKILKIAQNGVLSLGRVVGDVTVHQNLSTCP